MRSWRLWTSTAFIFGLDSGTSEAPFTSTTLVYSPLKFGSSGITYVHFEPVVSGQRLVDATGGLPLPSPLPGFGSTGVPPMSMGPPEPGGFVSEGRLPPPPPHPASQKTAASAATTPRLIRTP